MEKTEIIMALIALVAGPLGGWLASVLQRKKYKVEIEKMKAATVAVQTNTRGDELDNVKAAMDILMEQVVEPLKREINGFRKELARFRRVVEMANHCPHSAKCPVRDELQKSEVIEPDPPPRRRQPATHKKIRDEPCAYPDERGNTGDSFD